jgi:hypothetical protein
MTIKKTFVRFDKFEAQVGLKAKALRDKMKDDKSFRFNLEPIHQEIIRINPNYLCQIDGDFGLDLIKIKSECWKTELYNVVNSPAYERHSKGLMRQHSLIEFTVNDSTNLGQKIYEVVFSKQKLVDKKAIESMIALATKVVVLDIACVRFNIDDIQHPYVVRNGILKIYVDQ